MAPNSDQNQPIEDRPPVFSTWNQLYIFVLVSHAIIITIFYIFTKIYS